MSAEGWRFVDGDAMRFGSKLGELAGQDIVLWRDAGLDPHAPFATREAGLKVRLAELARSMFAGLCRGVESKSAPDPTLVPSPIHVIRNPHPRRYRR